MSIKPFFFFYKKNKGGQLAIADFLWNERTFDKTNFLKWQT